MSTRFTNPQVLQRSDIDVHNTWLLNIVDCTFDVPDSLWQIGTLVVCSVVCNQHISIEQFLYNNFDPKWNFVSKNSIDWLCQSQFNYNYMYPIGYYDNEDTRMDLLTACTELCIDIRKTEEYLACLKGTLKVSRIRKWRTYPIACFQKNIFKNQILVLSWCKDNNGNHVLWTIPLCG